MVLLAQTFRAVVGRAKITPRTGAQSKKMVGKMMAKQLPVHLTAGVTLLLQQATALPVVSTALVTMLLLLQTTLAHSSDWAVVTVPLVGTLAVWKTTLKVAVAQ